MNPKKITESLERISISDDFLPQATLLIEKWSLSSGAFDAVEPILRFMEIHPTLDFGMPGPLVHFVEGFYRHGYEQKLIESIERKPIPHTIWMLNRLINGTTDLKERESLVNILRQAINHPLSDASTQNLTNHFLKRL